MQKLHETSTMIDYFTSDGLTKKTGLSEWRFMIFKEILDNALDALEPLEEKHVEVNYDSDTRTLQVYDNGGGIPESVIRDQIYDFTKYASSKRFFITPSRGQQGQGLKTVICACRLYGYGLYWHTQEGSRVQFEINADDVSMGGLPEVTCVSREPTEKHGVEVVGITVPGLGLSIDQYIRCNPDVTFTTDVFGDCEVYAASAAASDKSGNTHITFYDVETMAELLKRQDQGKTYKTFLAEIFGQRVSKQSRITGKIGNIDYKSRGFMEDLEVLRMCQEKKKFTVLKQHMIGLSHNIECTDGNGVPYIVECEVMSLSEKRSGVSCSVMINNSVSYADERSIKFSYGSYKLGTRQTKKTYNLSGLLEAYTDYDFIFHFICPRPVFANAGKTEIDITGIMEPFTAMIGKAINKTHKADRLGKPKKESNTQKMRKYVSEAYKIASSGGKYAITARQIFYKLRELTGISGNDSLYNTFTQEILTEWLEENPDAVSNVYFSDRGVYIVDGKTKGIGTGTVREEVREDQARENVFSTVGGKAERISLSSDFEMKYRYNKVLYIEKTGFNDVFQKEDVAHKYNMIIASGQGFGTRAAKELLSYFEGQQMTIFCLHDLDYSGVNILESLRNGNRKFNQDITVIDLGITLEDVGKYGIEAERVKIDKKNKNVDFSKYRGDLQRFFLQYQHEGYYQRVELNAFTTQQILEIIDTKLKPFMDLPTVRPAEVVQIDRDRIRKAALTRVMLEKYSDMLEEIKVPEIAETGEMTVPEVQRAASGWIESMIQSCEDQIKEKSYIFQ